VRLLRRGVSCRRADDRSRAAAGEGWGPVGWQLSDGLWGVQRAQGSPTSLGFPAYDTGGVHEFPALRKSRLAPALAGSRRGNRRKRSAVVWNSVPCSGITQARKGSSYAGRKPARSNRQDCVDRLGARFGRVWTRLGETFAIDGHFGARARGARLSRIHPIHRWRSV
jgi:hypothetical protein